MLLRTLLPAALLVATCATAADTELPGAQHGTVVFEKDRFAGWPANNGAWIWGNEIVCGYSFGWFDFDLEDGHPIDRDKPSGPMQARSLDGGETWTLETPSYLNADGSEKEPVACPGGLDFTAPGFAFRLRSNRFYYSDDKCHTWQGPYLLPDFDRPGLLARTDYIVNGKHDLMAFLATEKDGGGEGWPCAIRTRDGGKTWEFVGWIGEQPGEGGYAIMPSTLELANGALLSIIRKRGQNDSGERDWWIDAYLSPNEGKDWYLLKAPYVPNHGNPPSMVRLNDGRIALTYGYREPNEDIRGMISADEGKTWGEEFIIHDGADSWDIGYPRTLVRPDGKCVTMYYWHDKGVPERYISYTIWTPPAEPAAE